MEMRQCMPGAQWLRSGNVLTHGHTVKKDTARQVSDLMVSMGASLDKSLSMVKGAEPDDEFRRYRESVSKILTTMLLEIMNPLYVEHPDLKPEQLR